MQTSEGIAAEATEAMGGFGQTPADAAAAQRRKARARTGELNPGV
jgi:hypothetical protein